MVIFSALLPLVCFSLALGDEPSDPIVLRSVEVDTTIIDAYTVTEITHTYENTGDESSEVVYSVIIPDKAFISNFSLTLNGTIHYAEILTKEEARERYEDAVNSGDTAGLGETSDIKKFTFRVNMQGGVEAEATLRYEQYLPLYLGQRSYELSLAAMDPAPETFSLEIDMVSTPGFSGLHVENYPTALEEDWKNSHHLTLKASEYFLEGGKDPIVVYSESPNPVNGSFTGYFDEETGEYYFMNVLSPRKSDIGGQFHKDIIFVLDKSGSMSGDKIKQLRQAFSEIIEQLSPEDRFNIIMFDNTIRLYSEELVNGSAENQDDAINYLSAVSAGGSTNLYDGLARALTMLTSEESRVPIIVMLTDGNANSGAYTSEIPIRENIEVRNNIFCPIFTLGFGYDVSFDFLRSLSMENYARAQQIHPGQDAGEQILNFYDTISTTLLKDIKVEFGDYAYDVLPSSIPALYEGSEAIVVGKLYINDLYGEFGARMTAFTPEGLKEFNTTYNVTKNDTSNDHVMRFWAYHRIFELMDSLLLASGAQEDEIISEIENLSIDAHFATPYTSLFLEIQEDAEEETGDDNGDGSEDDTYSAPPPKSTQDSGSQDSSNSMPNSPQPQRGGSLGLPSDPVSADDSEGDSAGFGAGDPYSALGTILMVMAFVLVGLTNLLVRRFRKS